MRQTRKDQQNKEKIIQNISPPSLSSISSANTIRKKQDSLTQQEKKIKLVDYKNGIYQGMIHPNQQRTNIGLFTWDSGEVYFGEWKHDMLDGEGILFFPYGGFIHGFFMKGKLSGAAFFKFSNGDIYEGFWRNGKLEGNCYKYFSDDERWILSDYKNGEFKKIISKGDGQPPSYVFNYITSTSEIAVRHQADILSLDGLKIESISFSDGGQYLGLVKNSMPTSLGIFKYSDGKYDVGFYKEGNLDGLGRLNLHNGDVYDGFLQNGLFHGLGCFYQKQTSSWIYGNFEQNKCVNILKKGQGNFPTELIEKIRMNHHKKAAIYIDKITSSEVYSIPQYNQIPVGPEKHNFFLDLSVNNQDQNNEIKKQITSEPFNMNKVLPKDLTSSNYQSPPPNRSKSSSKINQNPQMTSSVVSNKENMQNKEKTQQKQKDLTKERASTKERSSTKEKVTTKQSAPIKQRTTIKERASSNKSNEKSLSQSKSVTLKKSASEKKSLTDKKTLTEKKVSIEKKTSTDKKPTTILKKEQLKKSNLVSPPPRQGRVGSGGNSQILSNQSSNKKSTLKKSQTNVKKPIIKQTRSRQSSVSKIQNEKQDIDQQSIHDYDNMVQLMSQNPEQLDISQSQAQQINFDEVFNSENSPRSQHYKATEFKKEKSLAQIIAQEDFEEQKRVPFQKSKSMATFNSKKSSQSSTHKQTPNMHEIANVSKISGIGYNDSPGFKEEKEMDKQLMGGVIKPNIFGKKQQNTPQQFKSSLNQNKGQVERQNNAQDSSSDTESESSISSYNSDSGAVKKAAPGTAGKNQISSIKEEDRQRSYSGTPSNNYNIQPIQKKSSRYSKVVEQQEKPNRNQSENREDLEAEENKQFLEAERLSRQQDRIVSKTVPTEGQEEVYGQVKIKDFINIDDQQYQQQTINRGEQSRKSDTTPLNKQHVTVSNQQIPQKKASKDYSKQGSLIDNKQKQDITPSHIQRQNQEPRKENKKSTSAFELENLRNEIASYEQIAQKAIPQRRKESQKSKKDNSREPSAHPRTPQATVTPKQNQPNVSPNFQQSPILTAQQYPNSEYQQENDLDLADSEQILDSIKLLKQQYIHQINDLENKQKQMTTPTASSFKYNIVPNFNIPLEENDILKDDSLNQDISPQNPIEQYDSPFKRENIAFDRENSQGRGRSSVNSKNDNSRGRQYTKEEADKIAERIERNLIFQSREGKKSSSSQEDDFINEENMQVGDINDQIEINAEFKQNREEKVVRSKLENDHDTLELQQKQIKESLENAARVSQMINQNQQQMRESEVQTNMVTQNNQMVQTQSSMKAHSAQTSPLGQSPINSQSNIQNIHGQIVTGQVIQTVQEVLPLTQQTTIHQRKLSDNVIQSTVTTKIIQPVVTTKIISPIRSRPSSQSNSPLVKQQIITQNDTPRKIVQQGLLPQQVVHHIQNLVGGVQNQSTQNRVLSEQTQNKIVQAVNQKWKEKHPELFAQITPMQFYQSIIMRQSHLKDLTAEELEQLESDIQTLKKMNIFEDLQQIIEQNTSNDTSPMNKLEKDKQQNEVNMNAAQAALKAAAAAEQARKEYEVQQQYLQSHLVQSQNNSFLAQQQQKEIDDLKRQQEEFIKQQLIIQKQQSEYLEKLQLQQAYIIQQGDEQRKLHEEEKIRQLKEIEALEKQKSQRIQDEEERLRQLRDMQEKVRKQIEDDLQRKQHEDEEHSLRQQALFEKEQVILNRLEDEQGKLTQLLSEHAKLETHEIENKKVRQLQMQIEEENRQKEMLKLEELKREAAFLREQQLNNQNKSEDEIKQIRELQIKYAEDQRKQQERIDLLNSQKLISENHLREQNIAKQEEFLNQQQQIQEQQYILQQEQLRIQREREEQEILQKQRNEESYMNEQQRLQKIITKEKEIEMQAQQNQELFLSQQVELSQQKQQIESQKLDLIIEQERLFKKAQEDQQKINEAERIINETIIKKQQEEQHLSSIENEFQYRLKQQETLIAQQEELQRQQQLIEHQNQNLILEQEYLRKRAQEEEEKRIDIERKLQETLAERQQEQKLVKEMEIQLENNTKKEDLLKQQEEYQRQKDEIESQKIDLILEQERLRKKAQEEEEKRIAAEILLQNTLRQKQIEHDQEVIKQKNLIRESQIQQEFEQQSKLRKEEEKLREQQEQLKREKEEVERQRELFAQMERERIAKEQLKVKQEEEEAVKKLEYEQKVPRQQSLDMSSAYGVSSYVNNLSFKNQSANASPNVNRSEIDKMIRQSGHSFKETFNSNLVKDTYLPQQYQISSDKNDSADIVKRSSLINYNNSYQPSIDINSNLQFNPEQKKNVEIFDQIDKIVNSAKQSGIISPLNTKTDSETIKRTNRFVGQSNLDQTGQNEFKSSSLLTNNDILSKANTNYDVHQTSENIIPNIKINNIQNDEKTNSLISKNQYQPASDEYRGSLVLNNLEKSTFRSDLLKSYEPQYNFTSQEGITNSYNFPVDNKVSVQNQSNIDDIISKIKYSGMTSPTSENAKYQSTTFVSNYNIQPLKGSKIDDKVESNKKSFVYQPDSNIAQLESYKGLANIQSQKNSVVQDIDQLSKKNLGTSLTSNNLQFGNTSYLTNNNAYSSVLAMDNYSLLNKNTSVVSPSSKNVQFELVQNNIKLDNPIQQQNNGQFNSSITFNSLSLASSYLPATSTLPANNANNVSLDNQINSIEEKMKEINKKMEPFSVSSFSKMGDTSSYIGQNVEPNLSLPTANFDIHSSINSINKDSVKQSLSNKLEKIDQYQLRSSWVNPISTNSNNQPATLTGVSPVASNPISNIFTSSNNANQTSLFVSFGNERNQGANTLKSSTIDKTLNTENIQTGIPTYISTLKDSFAKNNQTSLTENQDQIYVKSSTTDQNYIYPISVQATQKQSLNLNSTKNTDIYVPEIKIQSPSYLEINKQNNISTPTSNIFPSSRLVGFGSSTLTNPTSYDKKNDMHLSAIQDSVEDDLKRSRSNKDSSLKLFNTINSSSGLLGNNNLIQIQTSPEEIQESQIAVIVKDGNNSKDPSFLHQDTSLFSHNRRISGTTPNNIFNNSFSAVPTRRISGGNDNMLNTSLTEEKTKQARKLSDLHNGDIINSNETGRGRLLNNVVSAPKFSQYNSPVSVKNISGNHSNQNSAANLNRYASPCSDTLESGVQLIKKTNITVVHSPDAKGAVSLVRSIQNTYTYQESANDDSFHNTSFHNNNRSLLESQASQFLQQTIHTKESSPVRKQIVIKKSDRLNMNPHNTQQRYYNRSQPIIEDLGNEGSDKDSNSKQALKKIKSVTNINEGDQIIEQEDQDNKCNIF